MKQKGSTLIEMVVTITVVVLLMAALLIMSRQGEAQAALLRSAQKLALDISRQQANAMSAKEIGDVIPCGYGVHFDSNIDTYILFVDLAIESDCSDQDFHLSPFRDKQISTGKFEAGIVVSSFNKSDIVFNPPEPQVNFYPEEPGEEVVPAEITLKSLRTSQTIKVIVTMAGQIYIE